MSMERKQGLSAILLIQTNDGNASIEIQKATADLVAIYTAERLTVIAHADDETNHRANASDDKQLLEDAPRHSF